METLMSIPGDDDFRALYRRLQLMDDKRPEMRLHDLCPLNEVCWRGARDRLPPKDQDWNEVSRPWIGGHYESLRLLFLAINMNGSGGFFEATGLVLAARDEILTGRTRVRFGHDYQKYPGTMLYHRMGVYASAFVETAKFRDEIPPEQSWPSYQNVAEAFEFMAYTNQVKCSPHDDQNSKNSRSEPTGAMWENCGKYVLAEELRLLNPRVIVVLGA
jgi:hypothetical protein